MDFYCASARLVIELDGSQHYEPQGLAYDAERSQFLMSLGLEILRFSNGDSSPKGRAKGLHPFT
ncbi:MAG: DUF559 domain-containing protein [Clostridium sp.]|nr:DUF559 domain-containing protein [Clostridium sp.]